MGCLVAIGILIMVIVFLVDIYQQEANYEHDVRDRQEQ